jgi:hypothetical protein
VRGYRQRPSRRLPYSPNICMWSNGQFNHRIIHNMQESSAVVFHYQWCFQFSHRPPLSPLIACLCPLVTGSLSLAIRHQDVHIPTHPIVLPRPPLLARPLHLFFHLLGRLVGQRPVFEQEGEFFKGATVGFREHKKLSSMSVWTACWRRLEDIR